MAKGNRPDPLMVNRLRSPLLNEFMVGQELKSELMDIAQEIKARYIAKVPKEKGKLAASVRIRPFKSKQSRDHRWNVDVTIGGIMGVDYADDIEREYGVLASVLREMGYKTGDIVTGPRGKGAKDAPEPRPRERSRSERIADLKANPDPEVQKYARMVESFSSSRRKLDSQNTESDYFTLRQRTMEIQATKGSEISSIGYTVMRDYRGARILSGMRGYPSEMDGGRPRLTQEMMDERRGEMGGVTWEMRRQGVEGPAERGEPDPLSNYFSTDELRYFGRVVEGD